MRGWCPGVFEPMPSGDGLLVRVKPPSGRLPAAALRAVAQAAARHGNGVIELTSRGNLQIRGLTASSAPPFAAAMVAAGLADADPARERRRNVIAVPPCDDALVAAVEAAMAGIEGLAPKFCIAVGPVAADIVVRDGRIWTEGRSYAFSLQTLCALAAAADGRRLAVHAAPVPPGEPAGMLLALPFGQTSADSLLRLAGLTEAARTTPWRALHIPAPEDTAPYEAAGFITDPEDPRRSIAACVGAPACASGEAPTRADAARLAAAGLRGLHVSGCAKGCAYPRAGLTLTARGGGYDVIHDGRASDAPDALGLTLGEAIAHLTTSAALAGRA